jgi:hypothetical protein
MKQRKMNAKTPSKRVARSLGPPFRYGPKQLVESYDAWVTEHLEKGWDGYLFTFMFRPLPGSMKAQIQQMHEEISRVYARLATRVVRNPTAKGWARLLPKGIFFPDFPVPKRSKQSISDASINDGLHFHGIVLAKRTDRLPESLNVHFDKNIRRYITEKILRIHSIQISHNGSSVTGYGGKAIGRKRVSEEHILHLPKSLDEISEKHPTSELLDPRERGIKAIQDATNVSEEVARDMYASSRHVSKPHKLGLHS